MSKDTAFWLTFCSLVTLFEMFCFIIFCSIKETFIFHKEYCLILLPNLLYTIFQFVVNYCNLTDEKL